MSAQLSDVGLEKAIIALILADNANLSRLGNLQPEDFTDPMLGAALAEAMNLHNDGRPVNLVTLKFVLETLPTVGGGTGLDVVRSLTIGETPPPIADAAHRVRSLAIRSRLRNELERITHAMLDQSQPMIDSLPVRTMASTM